MASALERGVWVIPVLIDGARPPVAQQLPAELAKLARLNALELSYGRYEYDADRLFDLIKRVVASASRIGTAPESTSAANTPAPAVSHDMGSRRDALGQLAQADREVARKDPARVTRLLIDAI